MKKIAILFLLFTLAFSSHKYYLSLTQIEYNKDQDSLEVIINVFMDDIEFAINKEYSVDLRLTTKQELEDVDSYFQKYLRKNLRFLVNKELVNYNFIGKEYEGDLVYFYLEVNVSDSPVSLEVYNTILVTYFEQQQNIIKFKNGSDRQSKILSKNTNKALLKF
ncbi:hypothetical protein N9V50_00710 [Flavobacteriaceae bacterium]|jgi:hypothetical protein|nr:hypothetical protein [Flavobacteriaceae bacterium]|tara:strand:- start:29933 stop:30421 length:489 start_codon:yes stop_codon:yes gene_type:complete